jgi:hypothetical protein
MLWLIVYHLLRAQPDAVKVAAMTDNAEVTDDTPAREDLIQDLLFHNLTATALRRKGFVGTASAEYARIHARLDDLLTELVGR